MQVGHLAVCGRTSLLTRVPLNTMTAWPQGGQRAGRRPEHASFLITLGQGAENVFIARLLSIHFVVL